MKLRSEAKNMYAKLRLAIIHADQNDLEKAQRQLEEIMILDKKFERSKVLEL